MKPTPEQVARYTAELHTKHDHIPGMAARIAKAAALVLAGDVRHDRHGYLVLSSRNDGAGYRLNDHGVCSCPDYANGAPLVRGIKMCKHRLAYNIHHRALVEALNQRILGRNDYGNRSVQRIYLGAYLTVAAAPSKTSKAHTFLWSDTAGLVGDVTWSNRLDGWAPATIADKIRQEKWLDNAAPIPTPAAVHIEDEIAAIVDRADTMARDAEIMPFPTWAAIHGHNLAR